MFRIRANGSGRIRAECCSYICFCMQFSTPVVFRPRTYCCVNTVSSYHHHASSMTRKNKLISYLPITPSRSYFVQRREPSGSIWIIPYRIDCTQIEATSQSRSLQRAVTSRHTGWLGSEPVYLDRATAKRQRDCEFRNFCDVRDIKYVCVYDV